MLKRDMTVDNRPTELKVWESLSEMTRDVAPQIKGNDIIGTYLDDKSFVGRSFDGDAKKLEAALDGNWGYGMDVVTTMVSKLEAGTMPKPKSRRRRRSWQEDGDEVCIDRLRSGQEFWRVSQRQVRNAPQNITLLVDIGANASVKSKDILWRGAAAVVVTKMLEEAGYRVELWAGEYAKSAYQDGTDSANFTCLKRSQSPLSVSSLINGVSGWCFRTMFFGAIAVSHKSRKASYGLGHHKDVSNAPEAIKQVIPSANPIIVEGVWNEDAAVKIVTETLTKLNGAES